MAWFLPHRDRQDLRAGSGCGPRRRPGSRRAPTPRSSTWRTGRFAELLAGAGARLEAGTVDVRGELPDRRPGPRAHGAAQPAARHRPRRAPTIAELLEPDRVRADRRRASDADVTIPSWRYDSTSEIDVVEEVARLFGYTVDRRAGAVVTARRPPHRPPARAAPAAGAAGRPRALPRRCRCRSWRPATSSGAACRATASRSRTRWSPRSRCCARRCCPGWSRRSPPTPLGATPGSACGRSATCSAGRPATAAPAPLPDEREMLGVALGGRDAAAAVREWRAVAELLAVRAASVVNGAVAGPAPHPLGAVSSPPAATSSARWARSTPLVLEAHGVAERVGLARGRPRRGGRPARATRTCTGRSASTRRATSTSPSRSTTRCRPPRSRQPSSGRAGARLAVAAPVRRLPRPRHRRRPAQPGLRAAARRPRPHAHRRRGGRGAARVASPRSRGRCRRRCAPRPADTFASHGGIWRESTAAQPPTGNAATATVLT